MTRKQQKNYIRQIRKEKGCTIVVLADLTGFSAPYITMLEKGERGLTWETMQKIADALGCHPMELVVGPTGGDDHENNILSRYRALPVEQKTDLDKFLKYLEQTAKPGNTSSDAQS